MPDGDPERQALVLDGAAAAEDSFRNCRHLIVFWIRGVDHGELHPARILRIVFRIAISQAHVALDREQVSEESAGEHDDEPGMGQLDSELAPGPTKTAGVRRDQVHEQDRTD